jgi:outer membrane protein assembly factor BamA
MKSLVLLAVIAVSPLAATPTTDSPAADNVNSRYTVESVELSKYLEKRMPRDLREELDGLVGRKFDPGVVADLAGKIRDELHVVVRHRIEKGFQPDHVRVIYEARERRWDEDDARVTKLSYHQKQGWTAGLELGFDAGSNRFELGAQSDADRLIERYSGFNLGYQRRFGDHIRFRFDFDTFHQQWNPATEQALLSRTDVPGIYRERYSMEPAVFFLITPNLSLSTGISIQHFQTQFPAARFEAANAVVTTLRHRRRWQSSGSVAGHELDAGYSLRAATNLLDSDFVYTRHLANASYSLRFGRQMVLLRALAGTMSGRAPLFERFALGDTRTLRGWNKFDVDPVGGSRVAHGSVQYQCRPLGVFYDTGAVWDRNRPVVARHSAGLTLALGALKDGPYITVAFPIRSGSIAPLFMLAMNF